MISSALKEKKKKERKKERNKHLYKERHWHQLAIVYMNISIYVLDSINDLTEYKKVRRGGVYR